MFKFNQERTAETAVKTANLFRKLSRVGSLCAVAIIAMVMINACGNSGPKEKTLSVSDVSISGDASEYFKVIDGDYTLKLVDDKIVIAVKLELVKQCPVREPKISWPSLYPELSILDKDGITMSTLKHSSSDSEKLESLLKGDVGKTVTMTFEDYVGNNDDKKRFITETESFEITKADFAETSSSSSNSSSSYSEEDDEPSVASSSSSEDWDAVLKSYESYIDQYIKLMKKAKNGDVSALTEYAGMMEKATDLSEKMENAGDELSATQMAKFIKLQTKLANAAASMY